MSTIDSASVKAVFEQRSMYDAVVDGDYMFHAEINVALGEWSRAFGRPLRIVDLGCGDARVAARGFADAAVASYVGVDLAESSIAEARRNTAVWSDRVDLICGDLLDALQQMPAGLANVVLASYSLHHFGTAEKRTLLAEIARVLEPNGVLLWLDAVRRDDESRDEYIATLTGEVMDSWTALTIDERERACEHIRTADFPETEAWVMEAIAGAGFTVGDRLFESDLFRGWELKSQRAK
ncbi:class I SAM-dependent methyltransferase [Lacipirellula sp.]|uniref:class I SAM-dependent methyltransferase n=1 Tax=Lacipirellula sp. TaxID=2691419 RepID=UPI003D098F35